MCKVRRYTRAGLLALLLILFPAFANAQGRVFTKKMHLSDFTTKTTKVVLSGGAILDAALKTEVTRFWQLSPYEFCDAAEYEKLKEKPDYYFLRFVRNASEGEDQGGIIFLSLIKGGKEQSPDPENKRVEIIRVPIAPAEYSSGREFLYLGAFLGIIQDYVEDAMEADVKAYAGLSTYNARFYSEPACMVWISKDDLGFEITREQQEKFLKDNVVIAPENDVDRVFRNGTRNTLVSYVVAPVSAQNGSWCYKMLISPDTHQLYYYRRHKVRYNAWKGFQLSDIKEISKKRK